MSQGLCSQTAEAPRRAPAGSDFPAQWKLAAVKAPTCSHWCCLGVVQFQC